MRALLLLPVFLVLPDMALPDIAPNPRHRSGLAVGPRGATEVAMRAEVVELTLHEGHAEVRAVFDLENTSDAAQELEVGFPSEAFPIEAPVDAGLVEGGSPFSRSGTIYAFAAEVDGAPVRSEHKEVDAADARRVHRHWVCWPMTFAGKQQRRVEVRYQVETRDPNYVRPFSPLEPRELIYVLKTGAGWKGVIGDARIVLRCAADMDFARVERVSPAPTQQGEKEWEWHMQSFEPDADIVVRYRAYRDAKDAIERTAAARQARPGDLVLLLDYAMNQEALGEHLVAAEVFARLAALPARGSRADKTLLARTYSQPLEFLAARCWAAAGRPDEVRRWLEPASAAAASRLDNMNRVLERAERGSPVSRMRALDPEREAAAKRRFEEAAQRRDELQATIDALAKLRAELGG